jgi:hypothetical protein
VSGPYRDENESLRAEVARLRAQAGSRRVPQWKLALLLVAVDFVAIIALRPWLNGTSDLKLWTGVIIVVGIGVGAVASARGFRRNSS